MAVIVDYDKVTTVLLQHGEWYEVDRGTFTSIPVPRLAFYPVTREAKKQKRFRESFL